MKKLLKHLRLLPMVVAVGFGVLALKGVDIARAAQGAVEDLDNEGLAPSDIGGAPRPDYANGDEVSDSASEVDVLTSLTRRRTELDARERGLAMRENLLNASEGRVNQKIALLQALQTQIQGLLKQRDAAQDTQIASLIKSYGPDGMKPAQAATIFNTMPDEVLLPIAKGMKPADLGAIMSKMNPDAAQRLTVKLAALLKLPQTATTAACPVPAAAPAAPGTAAAVTPTPDGNPPVTLDTPPQQTAAVTLPPTPAPAAATPPVQTPAPAPAKPQQTAAATPPPTPAKPQPATPPAPAKPETTAAAAPPKPHHVAHAAPPPNPAPPPVTLDKPVQAAAAPPPKPTAATLAPAQAASATPPKPVAATPAPATAAPAKPASPPPTQAAATPPKPSTTTPAPTQAAAATPPPAAAAASGAPTPLTH